MAGICLSICRFSGKDDVMQNRRRVRLFRNGRNQALRIPREFEMDGREAVIHREGNKLIIEPVRKKNLLELLSSWEPLNESMPEIQDTPVEPENIF